MKESIMQREEIERAKKQTIATSDVFGMSLNIILETNENENWKAWISFYICF